MVESLLQFGLGVALIGAYFIPRSIAKDKELSELNKALQAEKDKRLDDVKEMRDTVLEPVREFNSVAQALINLKTRGGHE